MAWRHHPSLARPGCSYSRKRSACRDLLEGAGFGIERVEDVPVLLTYDDVDAYITAARDTGGMFARIWRDALDDERETIKTRLVESFASFAADGGYELPGVAVVALAS